MDSIAKYCSQKDEIKALKDEVKRLNSEVMNITSAYHHYKQITKNKINKYINISFMLGEKNKNFSICTELQTSTGTIAKVKKLLAV